MSGEARRSRTTTSAPDLPAHRAEPLDEVLGGFPRERQWLLPAFHAVQHALGHLSADAIAGTAAHLRVPLSEAYGVATHYPEFRLEPRGRRHVRVCTGVSCALAGGRELLDALARRFGVEPGETGADREVTLEAADCFFACSVAPLVEVDGRYRGRVTPDDLPVVLDDRLTLPAGDPPETRERQRVSEGSCAPGAPATCNASAVATSSPAATAEEFLAAVVARAAERAKRRPALRLLVQTGTCGRAVGGEALLAALRRAVSARGIAAEVIEGACNGMCYAAPLVEVRYPGWPRAVLERVEAGRAPLLVERLAGDVADLGVTGVAWADSPWRGLTPAAAHPFWRHQERVLLARAGVIDAEDLDDALLDGAYAALARALDGPPEALIEAVKASGVQGRGGAFFPTALKWEACRKAPGEPKYVVLNAEEGEPGIFKDRHLMESDPHQVLEGVLLAAYAAGATRAILYVHGEADLSAARLARAVAQAEAAGIVGARVLGRPPACHVELRRGAGGFVLGEETALLESIEGRRAQPRTRPPFPVESGLWGKPTVINNVETLAAIPSILRLGGGGFAALGTGAAPGTKVFGLSGPILRPGVVETRNGVTLATLLREIGGGLADGRRFEGAVVGGPSGSIVPAALFDVPMEPRGRVSPGTGGIVALPEGAGIAEVVRTLLAFNARESCGKCTPCREGLPRLLAMLDDLDATDGRATGRARELGETIQAASLCGLGQAAPLALLRALDTFADRFRPGR